ncbi:OmpA family protein [Kamptonema cortianum]|nr:OmpA family protein [Kamptonema cortianum]MDL5049735.1 OmpA family protein [Oscillatoria amoena NRMC-F 0135]
MKNSIESINILKPLLICAGLLFFVGCASDDLQDPGGPGGFGDAGGWDSASEMPSDRTFGIGEGFDPDKNLDKETLKLYNVQFGFDSSTVAPDQRPKLEAVAKYMKANPQINLYILGHTDERGTADYNRALGERRAIACRDYLIGLGISGQRIGTMSYGFERPIDPSSNERAWALNRRAEFGIVKK